MISQNILKVSYCSKIFHNDLKFFFIKLANFQITLILNKKAIFQRKKKKIATIRKNASCDNDLRNKILNDQEIKCLLYQQIQN